MTTYTYIVCVDCRLLESERRGNDPFVVWEVVPAVLVWRRVVPTVRFGREVVLEVRLGGTWSFRDGFGRDNPAAVRSERGQLVSVST